MKFAGSAAMRGMDAWAIHKTGIPSDTLMLRAAAGAAEAAAEQLARRQGKTVVVCGSGNNGGDGIAVAALLLQKGLTVDCYMVGNREKMTPDAKKMQELLEESGGSLLEYTAVPDFTGCSLIVDALFGTGLSRDISGRYAELIAAVNRSGCYVLSCDIPSGICADTGRILGCAVHADETVTFNLPKTGQLLPPGTEYTGRLLVHDIGIPPEAVAAAETDGEYVTAEMVSSWLPEGGLETHKGDYGKLLLLCGAVGYTGAPAMAARAALRTGAGLVYLGVPERIYGILAGKLDEPVIFPGAASEAGGFAEEAVPGLLEKLQGKHACLLGPGIGISTGTEALTKAVLQAAGCPVVLDADALTLAARHPEWIREAAAPVVLTPHEGEFSRFGISLEHGRLVAAAALAQQLQAVVVLKGYRTVTASPKGVIYVNSTGNPGMAVGGSGDVLAGMLTCLLGQGMEPEQAAAAAVYLHGAAGDFCCSRLGRRSMLPTDMIEALPQVFRQLENSNWKEAN